MTSTFFSTLPDDYEQRLKEEIYGCFKHIGIPIETIYHMPVQDRRFFIMKHNAEQEALAREQEAITKKGSHQSTINTNLNSYAKMEQSNNNARRR